MNTNELLETCTRVENTFATYLEEGRLVNAGDKDIMPIVWGVIEDLRAAINTPENRDYLPEQQEDVKNAVLGAIKSRGPICFHALMNECIQQVINFEKNTHIWQTSMVDIALNQLTRTGQIDIESSYEYDNETGRYVDYVVVFRANFEVNNDI